MSYGWYTLEGKQETYETAKANLCLVLVGLRPLIDKPDPNKQRAQLRAVVKAFGDFETAESEYNEKLAEEADRKKAKEAGEDIVQEEAPF